MNSPCMINLFCPIFFKLFSLTEVLFVEPLIPLFWTSGEITSVFQSQSGQPYSHLEVLVIYILWDTPLVWHLPISLQQAWQPVASPHACFSRSRMQVSIGRPPVLNQPHWLNLEMITRHWYGDKCGNGNGDSIYGELHPHCFPFPVSTAPKAYRSSLYQPTNAAISTGLFIPVF